MVHILPWLYSFTIIYSHPYSPFNDLSCTCHTYRQGCLERLWGGLHRNRAGELFWKHLDASVMRKKPEKTQGRCWKIFKCCKKNWGNIWKEWTKNEVYGPWNPWISPSGGAPVGSSEVMRSGHGQLLCKTILFRQDIEGCPIFTNPCCASHLVSGL